MLPGSTWCSTVGFLECFYITRTHAHAHAHTEPLQQSEGLGVSARQERSVDEMCGTVRTHSDSDH